MSVQQLEEVFYPTADGKPMAETGFHVNVMVELITLLRLRYAERDDVYVIGNIFLFWEMGKPASRRSPDVMVIKGVSARPERDSFKTWEEGAVPCVVFEITSNETKNEDVGPKKELYEKLGVREYFLFDPLGHYLDRPLMGYVLHRVTRNGNGNGDPAEIDVHNEYAEILPGADGSLISQELGVRITPVGETLRLFDLETGEQLLAPYQLYQQANKLVAEVDQQRKRTESAEKQAKDEKQRAESAEKQAKDEKQRAESAEKKVGEQAKRILELEEKLKALSPSPPGEPPDKR